MYFLHHIMTVFVFQDFPHAAARNGLFPFRKTV